MKKGDRVQLKRIDKKEGTIDCITEHWNEKPGHKLISVNLDGGGYKITSNKNVKVLST